jgi:type II secretory pathway component PulF
MTQASNPATFAYRAQSSDGASISGTIDAADLAEATRRLQSLHLTSLELQPAAHPPRARALGGEDFIAFNQQLAQLTQVGLPVEQGLRLIAGEMSAGSQRRTLELIAAELESGKSLPQAVAAHRQQFPPLYSELIDAGIRCGNLSGILLNLGRHLTLVRRLQAALWQTLAYPVMVMVAFLGVMYFILARVVPGWEPIIDSFANKTIWFHGPHGFSQTAYDVPWLTQGLFDVARVVAACPLWGIALIVAAVVVLLVLFFRAAGGSGRMGSGALLHVPLVGTVLRKNLVSRWCDAVALGVDAGMDLPAAIKLSDDAIASEPLNADGQSLISALSAGRQLDSVQSPKVLPLTVIAAMQLSSLRGDLPQTLSAMSQMYQQQAELRLGAIQAILTPILLVAMGLAVGIVMVALFAPLLALLNL